MRHSEEILLTLLRAGLCGVIPETPLSGVRWAEVLHLAQRQDVAAVAWQGVETLVREGAVAEDNPIDKATKLQWAYVVERCMKRYRRQRRVIARLAETFGAEGIKMMILKGYGLSLCYPTPEYRPCVDVDIWLYGEQHRGDAVVREVLGAMVEDDRHHHTVFYVDGVMIENHFDFLNIHSHLSNRDLERELLRCTEEQSEVVDVDGEKVFLPPLNMHALFLVRHAAAHFAAVEIVLRHIVDWAMFLSRYHNDIDWQWLYSICREHKMDKFLDALNLLAVEVCGIDEAYIPVVTRRRDIEQRILRDILSPEFSERQPEGGVVRVVWYKWRRWWANRWKHQLVYRDSLATTLLTQVRSHLLKPTTIRR